MYGERIRQLRKIRGLNQADLAELTGVSRPNISFWENAQYPPLEAVIKVCKALNIEVWEFFLTEDMKTRFSGINPGIMELIERLSRIETGSIDDVLEIFYVILAKFDTTEEKKEAAGSSENTINGGFERGSYLPQDSDMIADSRIPLNRLPYYARHAGKIALEHYFNSLAWLSN